MPKHQIEYGRPLTMKSLRSSAYRCAFLPHRWSATETVDRTGRGKFVEVYPAGALARWGLDGSGYKGANREALEALLDRLRAAWELEEK